MKQKERSKRAQPEWKNSVSVRCPNCQTLWHCYGMRKQAYYTCVVCNHCFKLPEARLSDWGAIEMRGGRHRRFNYPSRLLGAA